jgi:hypothetical protein
MTAHSTRFGVNLVFAGTVAQTVETAKRAADVGFDVVMDKIVWRVGYGAMRLAGDGLQGPPVERGEALAVLRAAIDAGVDHIDTAQFYGPGMANELIREALFPTPKDWRW